jgi:hypothetical protein
VFVLVSVPQSHGRYAASGVFGGGIGASVTVDNPAGGEAKALLQAADGSGLRCDLQGMVSGRSGGGTWTSNESHKKG